MGRVFIVGGTGYLGSKVKSYLLAGQDQVVSASRRELDLENPNSYGIVDLFDTVVVTAESTLSAKICFFDYCLERGKFVVETSADPHVIEAISRRYRGSTCRSTLNGKLVIGMGVFPGLSNLLARKLVDRLASQRSKLELTVSTSPFSGAGQEMCRLMVQFLMEPERGQKKYFLLASHFQKNRCFKSHSLM